MPRKRGIRSGHRREFRVVRATALRKKVKGRSQLERVGGSSTTNQSRS